MKFKTVILLVALRKQRWDYITTFVLFWFEQGLCMFVCVFQAGPRQDVCMCVCIGLTLALNPPASAS